MTLTKSTDFNGDGIEDIIVGAPGANSGIGKAYVVYGNASGISESFDVLAVENREHVGLLLSGTSGETFSYSIGYAVAAAGCVVYGAEKRGACEPSYCLLLLTRVRQEREQASLSLYGIRVVLR